MKDGSGAILFNDMLTSPFVCFGDYAMPKIII